MTKADAEEAVVSQVVASSHDTKESQSVLDATSVESRFNDINVEEDGGNRIQYIDNEWPRQRVTRLSTMQTPAETHFKDTDVDEDDDPQYVDNEWPRLRVTRRSTIHLKETLMLPQSTHSLLFTGSVVSLPFAFAFSIVIVSYSCLALALVNNLLGGYPGNIMNVPVAVVPSVRGAQYLAILVCLLLEDEIPTSLHLIRKITKTSLKRRLPEVNYWQFAGSALIRMGMGYLFLVNVFLVIVQADAVLDLFYDVLALQFVQNLDDIGFVLAKMDVLGKRLHKAASNKCFLAEFEKEPFRVRRRLSFITKSVYFFNLVVFVVGVSIISYKQTSGYYQCESVSVSFGDDIWDEAFVKNETNGFEEMVLVYSYFNGVYKQNGTHDGRPVYTEQRKFDGTPFESVIGAEIKYCLSESAWVFTHENIRRSTSDNEDDCPWLLRSPDTQSYDLLDVTGDWSVWKGVIASDARMSVTCNGCKSDSECNLNGVCTNGKCICGDEHFGLHCGHRRPCKSVISETNATFSLTRLSSKNFREYNRPVYSYESGLESFIVADPEHDQMILVFSGSRWFGMIQKGWNDMSPEARLDYAKEFHAFWNRVFTENALVVSDTATSSMSSYADVTPVGTDFYRIGKQGKQYGPFGLLEPLQDPPGRGFFSCVDEDVVLGGPSRGENL